MEPGNTGSILRDLLRILTPAEIDDLSRIYLSFFRRSLTGLLNEQLDLDRKEMGYDLISFPPYFPPIKKNQEKENNIPPILGMKVIGGANFIVDEKEKFQEVNKKQKRLRSNYQKSENLKGKPSKGVLINKKCS